MFAAMRAFLPGFGIVYGSYRNSVKGERLGVKMTICSKEEQRRLDAKKHNAEVEKLNAWIAKMESLLALPSKTFHCLTKQGETAVRKAEIAAKEADEVLRASIMAAVHKPKNQQLLEEHREKQGNGEGLWMEK